MSNIQTGTNAITTIEDNDILYVGRPSAASGQKDKSINGSNLKNQINTVANGTWSSKSTVNGATDLVAIGAVASYTGFEIQFTITDGTYVSIGKIRLIYSNSTVKAFPPEYMGDISITYSGSGAVKIEQCSVSAGQMYWRITNNSGITITTQYKVTQFPA